MATEIKPQNKSILAGGNLLQIKAINRLMRSKWFPGIIQWPTLLLFMVIIGGMGSIMGSFFGAAFIVILPIFLNQFLPWAGSLVGVTISTAAVSHTEFMIFGALIVWFLIVEPHGLAKLWSIAKQKLRLWPFPH